MTRLSPTPSAVNSTTERVMVMDINEQYLADIAFGVGVCVARHVRREEGHFVSSKNSPTFRQHDPK